MRGTKYVAEIQERISKIQTDEDYHGSINASLDVVVQLDRCKQDLIVEKEEKIMLKKENVELKQTLEADIQSLKNKMKQGNPSSITQLKRDSSEPAKT